MVQRDAESRLILARLNLDGVTADPTDVKEGDIWYRSDVQELRMFAGGIKVKFTATAA